MEASLLPPLVLLAARQSDRQSNHRLSCRILDVFSLESLEPSSFIFKLHRFLARPSDSMMGTVTENRRISSAIVTTLVNLVVNTEIFQCHVFSVFQVTVRTLQPPTSCFRTTNVEGSDAQHSNQSVRNSDRINVVLKVGNGRNKGVSRNDVE